VWMCLCVYVFNTIFLLPSTHDPRIQCPYFMLTTLLSVSFDSDHDVPPSSLFVLLLCLCSCVVFFLVACSLHFQLEEGEEDLFEQFCLRLQYISGNYDDQVGLCLCVCMSVCVCGRYFPRSLAVDVVACSIMFECKFVSSSSITMLVLDGDRRPNPSFLTSLYDFISSFLLLATSTNSSLLSFIISGIVLVSSSSSYSLLFRFSSLFLHCFRHASAN
jgi:hypothetical protein